MVRREHKEIESKSDKSDKDQIPPLRDGNDIDYLIK